MDTTNDTRGIQRLTGALFVVGALSFGVAATVLSATFDWPDILREPASVVLPEYADGGNTLTWTWFATAWTYALLAIPIMLLPVALRRRDDVALTVATALGALSVLLSLIGFLRWFFVVPPLADSYVGADSTNRAAIDAAWTTQHQFGGALLGEHLGQLLAIAWSVTLSVVILRSGILPRWLGISGIAVSVLYLANQGDILSTAISEVPTLDLVGAVGSTLWALWILALGTTLVVGTSRASTPQVSRTAHGPSRGRAHS